MENKLTAAQWIRSNPAIPTLGVAIPKQWDVKELYSPYSGPDAASVLQSRTNGVASHILYSVGRQLGIMYFAEQDEAEEDSLYEAQCQVHELRKAL